MQQNRIDKPMLALGELSFRRAAGAVRCPFTQGE
jgi:hypothetical protein